MTIAKATYYQPAATTNRKVDMDANAMTIIELDGDSDYYGTLSPLTRYGSLNTSVANTSTKRERGKVKGNKRKPLTRTVALSECKVYRNADDYNNGIVAKVIEAPSRKRNRSTKRNEQIETIEMIEKAQHARGIIKVTEVTGEFDRKHLQQY